MQSDDEGRKNGHLTCATMAEMELWTPLPPSFFCAGTVVPQCCASTAFFCAVAHFFCLRHKNTCRHTFLCLIRKALITFADIPHHKRKEIIYTKVVCEIREGKDDENCTRITVGGNIICYPGDSGTNTALLELINLMLNSVISRKGGRFACIDIKKFLPRHANGRSRIRLYQNHRHS
jgi:hypothetical protein